MMATTMEHLMHRAQQIHAKVRRDGPTQVRLDGERVLTFKHPAPRGYGVRGFLIGVYVRGVAIDWILADLVSLIPVVSDTENDISTTE